MDSSTNQTVKLNDFISLIHAIKQPSLETQALLSLIDYTFLNSNPEPDKLNAFVDSAFAHQQLAGICVYAHHLHFFTNHPGKKVTVINFPSGDQSDLSVFGQFDSVVKVASPDEIDYVFPYKAYRSGQTDNAITQCKKIINHCREAQITIKIIIESGVFDSPADIYDICQSVLQFNPDFIKTSTGFSKTGATFEATTAICQAIKDSGIDCGIKVSGGIKDALTACRFAHIAETILEKTVESSWFRIGTSSLVEELSPAI